VADDELVGVRVLVVDDHDDSRDMYDQGLRFFGATVLTARTAREALAAAVEVDVIVTDLMLPREDGIWLLEQVSVQVRPIPVLVVTGAHESDLTRLATAAFARKLQKPVDPWQLCREIRDVLDARQA
jgi:CheY-like chemotaxis protein